MSEEAQNATPDSSRSEEEKEEKGEKDVEELEEAGEASDGGKSGEVPIPPPVPQSGISILAHKIWIGNLDKRLTQSVRETWK